MKTMTWLEKDRTFILVHGEQTPSDAEWNEYAAALSRHASHFPELRVLVVSKGGGPNMAQRRKLREFAASGSIRTAVISSSPIARTIVTLIRLTHPEIAAFHPGQRQEAYAHLRIPESERPGLDLEVAGLQRALEQSGTASPAV